MQRLIRCSASLDFLDGKFIAVKQLSVCAGAKRAQFFKSDRRICLAADIADSNSGNSFDFKLGIFEQL